MLSFWVLAGLLTCVATALVVWPLLSRRSAAPADPADEEGLRLAVYRDRRREIRTDREAGRLTPEEAERALDELVAEAAVQFPNAGEALRAGTPPATRRLRPALIAAVASAVVVPLVALAVYSVIGSPAILGIDASAPGLGHARVAEAVRQLEERVAKNPNDGEGWSLLGEALVAQNEPSRAAQAYGKAVALLPPDARLLADYAESLALVHNGEFAGRPIDLLGQALRIDPKETKALSLMAAAQYRTGNIAEALRLLRMLVAEVPAGAPEHGQLRDVITQLETELSKGGGAPAVAAAPAATARSNDAAPAPGAAAAAPAIAGTVTIDDALRAKLPPGATLFIVARDPAGPRTPLAVRRAPVGTWPVPFALGDADAMDPSRPISGARSIVIEARVSASGQAMRQSGDPFGESPPLEPGARDVTVRIDRQVP